MYLHTVNEPKTPDLFIGRLREVEKIAIRGATPDGLEHLRLNDFLSDGPLSEESMIEVQRKLLASFATAGASNQFGATWAI